MATIRTRKQSDGTVRYTAVVRIRTGNRIIHQEYKSFAHRSAAVSWAKHRELDLENPGKLLQKQHSAITLAQLIRWYIETFETISKWQRSKQSHLQFLERHSIGKANVFDARADIPMVDIMEFAIASARRQAEICRLARRDNDSNAKIGPVGDAKPPTTKGGNHRRFEAIARPF